MAPQLAAAAACLLMTAGPASAALGGDEATIDADQVHLTGVQKVSRAQRFAVHEIRVPTGTVVREYVSPDGKVFGIAWSGSTMPDLRQLMGEHFDHYVQAVGKRGMRGLVQLDEPELVVRSSGHMRAFSGSAYLPQVLPAGVSGVDVH